MKNLEGVDWQQRALLAETADRNHVPIRLHLQLWTVLLTGVVLGTLFLWPIANVAQDVSSHSSPTFYRDVLPILEQHCQSCHRAGGIAPIPFETFEQTRPFASVIRRAAEEKSMPPWFADSRVGRFSNDPSLQPAEIVTLAAWAEAKAPAGEARDAPPPGYWKEGWSIPTPNLVLKMTQPVPLPASGDIEYTYEIVPTNFKEDRWVQMAEVAPSLRSNVHHAVVYVRPPDSKWMRHAPVGIPFTASTLSDPDDRRGAHWTDSDVLLVYAPGSSPDRWPDNMAKFIPAGSDLVFQMHYTASGHTASDQSRIALIFSKHTPEQRVLTLQLTNDHFVIPPGAPDYRVESRGTLPNDATLLSFFPHMHLRGKRFEYNLIHRKSNADGNPVFEIEPLLRVNYHFHWQMSYRLTEPRLLKAGTELQAIAWYDNSKANTHNPDANAEVRWGEQTYDEMMVGFFDVAVPAGVDKQRFFIRTHDQAQVH
jgi:hypothetical protein